jgi:hypothetical protein
VFSTLHLAHDDAVHAPHDAHQVSDGDHAATFDARRAAFTRTMWGSRRRSSNVTIRSPAGT